MTTFDKAVEEIESRFRVGWAFPDILAIGRWVNPAMGAFGALILGGYLLTADPATPMAPAAAAVSAVQMAPSAAMPAQLALSSDTPITVHSSAAHDESTRTSMIDLVKAVFGAMFALAWAMIGAWLGVRRARALSPVDDSGNDGHATTDSTARNAHDPSRGPARQRVYDETPLVRNMSGAPSFRR